MFIKNCWKFCPGWYLNSNLPISTQVYIDSDICGHYNGLFMCTFGCCACVQRRARFYFIFLLLLTCGDNMSLSFNVANSRSQIRFLSAVVVGSLLNRDPVIMGKGFWFFITNVVPVIIGVISYYRVVLLFVVLFLFCCLKENLNLLICCNKEKIFADMY